MIKREAASVLSALGCLVGFPRGGAGQIVPEQLRTPTAATMALNVTMTPYNARPYDSTVSAANQDMGPRIQAAMNEACTFAAGQPGKGPPVVYIPRGLYLYKTT